jgi:hypothetical protein
MTQRKNLHATAMMALLVFFGSFVVPGTAWGAAEDPLENARKLIRAGSFEEAEMVLTAFIERTRAVASQERQVASAHYLLARLYYEVGDDLQCEENLRAALQLDPLVGKDESNADLRLRLERVKALGTPRVTSKEKEGAPNRQQVKKKFPWLLVAGIAVAAVIVVILLTRNKDRTLTVEVGAGVSGSPRAGSYVYRKGTKIEYEFEVSGEYKDLLVKIAGEASPGSGTLILDHDIRLEASATPMAAVATLVVRGPDHCQQLAGSPALFTSVLPGRYSLQQVSGAAYFSPGAPFGTVLACYTDPNNHEHVAAIAIPQFSALEIGHAMNVTHLYTFFVDSGTTADNSGEVTLHFGSLQVKTQGKDNCFQLSELPMATINIPAGNYRIRYSGFLYWASERVDEVLVSYLDSSGTRVFGSVGLLSANMISTSGGAFHAFLARNYSGAEYFSGEIRLEFLQ